MQRRILAVAAALSILSLAAPAFAAGKGTSLLSIGLGQASAATGSARSATG